jgi:uncharacterized repeat protein (TIGR03803 family)
MENISMKTRLIVIIGSLGLSACSSGATMTPTSPSAPSASFRAAPDSLASSQTDGANYGVLYRFKGVGGAGAIPLAGLTSFNSTLYGATALGGGECPFAAVQGKGCGTVFSFDPTTKKTNTLFNLTNAPSQGDYPSGTLLAFNSKLYGTTTYGGTSNAPCRGRTYGCGVIFSTDPASGDQSVVYRFHGGANDGSNPAAGLVSAGGKLYGTTVRGGNGTCGPAYNMPCGTLFSFDPSTGHETVVFKFTESSGWAPQASVVNVGNVLYGTTSTGTVFSYDLSTSVERTLHTFSGNLASVAPLLALNNLLYGTATEMNGASGGGLVFEINPASGRERDVYDFQGGHDGASPVAGLIFLKGTLYGTTMNGGTRAGHGTIFAVDRVSGKERVLHRFAGGHDGANPVASLTALNGVLYGTTASKTSGGPFGFFGTIFQISP